jgi:hypothetical protein
VFAAACAESYLFEWVRDEVLKHDYRALETYFPPGTFRPITDKWKEVPKQLKAEGRIRDVPPLGGGTAWPDFGLLVEFRNGLLHARSSRPETAGLPEASLPRPSMQQLDDLASGWAVGVVRQLILELCSAAGTPPPEWLNHK